MLQIANLKIICIDLKTKVNWFEPSFAESKF